MIIRTEQKYTISPYIYMQFMEPLGTTDSSVDAGWDFLHERWQPALMELVSALEPPMVRFGGCFASYYHWKEGVGPRASRVPMLNLCWDGEYSNQVGTAEIVDFCRQVKAEPLLVVNMESDGRERWAHPKEGMDRLGTAEEAAEWVAYCNDPDNALRKSHGAEEPYNVRWWQIGNETSYDREGFNVDQCAAVTKKFAKAMHAADPSVKLMAWCDDGWAKRIVEEAGDEIGYLAFHHHFKSGLPDDPLTGTRYRDDPDETWRHMMHAYVSLENKIADMRAQALALGKRLAMTEGHFILPGRNRCEVLSSWAAGVAYARCLLVIERAADVLDVATMADFFGNRWQVNAILLSTPVRSGKAHFQPVGEVMRLFRHHIGTNAVELTNVPAGVDAAGSVSADGGTLYLHLANTDRTAAKRVPLEPDGAKIASATAYEIAADSTLEITPLTPNLFSPVRRRIEGNTYWLPAAGVAAVEITLKQ